MSPPGPPPLSHPLPPAALRCLPQPLPRPVSATAPAAPGVYHSPCRAQRCSPLLPIRLPSRSWACHLARHSSALLPSPNPPPQPAGDVGEAFKHLISRRLYLGSYAVVAAYSLLDTADKGRRAYSRTHQARAEAAPSPAFAAGGSLPARPRSLPDLPLASAAASATVASAAAFAHTAAGVAAACAACLPPPAAYGGAAASSIAEQHSTAVPVAAAVLDATLFHATASLAIPALAINRCGCGARLEVSWWE